MWYHGFIETYITIRFKLRNWAILLFFGIVSLIVLLPSTSLATGDNSGQIWGTWQEWVLNRLLDEKIDLDVAVRVIDHESSWDVNASHTNNDGSVDRGLWQISKKWHPEITDECAFNPYCSTDFAITLIKSKRGWHYWSSLPYIYEN